MEEEGVREGVWCDGEGRLRCFEEKRGILYDGLVGVVKLLLWVFDVMGLYSSFGLLINFWLVLLYVVGLCLMLGWLSIVLRSYFIFW